MSNAVFIRSNRKFERIELSELIYVESLRGYIKLYSENRSWMIYTTMLQLEQVLPPERFVRIHRSYIIAIDRVISFDKASVMIRTEKGNLKVLEMGLNQYRKALQERVVVLGDAAVKTNLETLNIAQ